MMRVAEFLLRWTGDAVYADYWEKNLYNGVMAQTYWDGRADHTNAKKYDHPQKGLLTYFLPMKAERRSSGPVKPKTFSAAMVRLYRQMRPLQTEFTMLQRWRGCLSVF